LRARPWRGALSVPPDILHCHDWQSGLAPVYLRTTFANDPTFLGSRVLFTIHNLGYQGLFPPSAGGPGAGSLHFESGGPGVLRQRQFHEGGLNYSHRLNTVSPTYAREIQTEEYGFGLDGVLRSRAGVLTGILNAVDYCEWSPETDPLIRPTTRSKTSPESAPARNPGAGIRPSGRGHGGPADRNRLGFTREGPT